MNNSTCGLMTEEEKELTDNVRTGLPVLEVTTGLLLRNGKFFCGRRRKGMSMAGKWEFPGGKIEPGETAERCVVRELAEELHVSAAVLASLGVIEHDYDDFRIRLHDFICEITDGSEPASAEHTDASWRTVSELENLGWDECDIRIFPRLKRWLDGNGD